MANTNPARGMRDFLPSDVRKREYVIGIIKEVYQSYGFEPLETPSVENLETLMGKYGEEGNQLIFKILERGEKIQKKLAEGAIKNENELSDLALRYDLTVPLARVVANYKNELPKFFKRYQIQPVWRADRPARGRFREFYQCDVDAIGSKSMIVEAELISAVCEILERLGFTEFIVKLNHRELLLGLLDSAGIPDEYQIPALIALDKTDKISLEGVVGEFAKIGLSEEFVEIAKLLGKILGERRRMFREIPTIDVFKNGFSLEKYNEFVKEVLLQFVKNSDSAKEGLESLTKIIGLIPSESSTCHIELDPILARGLSYYTGPIFEITLSDTDFPVSIAGGGRYDGLIGMFDKEQIPACGFSLGLERILVVMEERGEFDRLIKEGKIKIDSADVMITVWDRDDIEENITNSMKLASELRSQGLRVLVYPEADKLGKQFKYAGQTNIPFVCILGDTELAENKVAVKNMLTGEQETVAREDIARKIKK